MVTLACLGYGGGVTLARLAYGGRAGRRGDEELGSRWAPSIVTFLLSSTSRVSFLPPQNVCRCSRKTNLGWRKAKQSLWGLLIFFFSKFQV